MNEEQFHKRVKEIIAKNRGPHDSPASQIHEMMARQVRGLKGKGWDEQTAVGVIRQFEWATGTQPKTAKISEADVKKLFSEYLKSRKYTFIPIPEVRSKTPDGYINGFSTEYISEIKSPELKLDDETRLYKFKTTHRKILDFIHKAVKQFEALDIKHEKPRVMVFTSIHSQLNWKSFTDAIQGGVVSQKGGVSPDLSKTPVYQSTLPLFTGIDLYVWYQISEKRDRFFQASFFVNEDSKFVTECEQLVKNLSNPKISMMDNTYAVRFAKR